MSQWIVPLLSSAKCSGPAWPLAVGWNPLLRDSRDATLPRIPTTLSGPSLYSPPSTNQWTSKLSKRSGSSSGKRHSTTTESEERDCGQTVYWSSVSSLEVKALQTLGQNKQWRPQTRDYSLNTTNWRHREKGKMQIFVCYVILQGIMIKAQLKRDTAQPVSKSMNVFNKPKGSSRFHIA